MARSRKRRRWPWVILFSAIALVGVFYVGGAWYFSGQVYADALKAEPYDPADLQRGTVAAYDPTGEQATVTILPDEADREETKFDDAVIGLALDESLLVVGPATRAADGTQIRPVLDAVGGAPEVGDRYGLTRDVWLDPEQAGLDSQDVVITTPDGRQFPAWQILVEEPTKWAILTHGKGASRSEMLRMATALHAVDYNVLIITYTGDVGAPPYDDGMVHFGRTEWQELQAAVEYADAAGAETIVLGGASHGGAVTLGFLARRDPRCPGLELRGRHRRGRGVPQPPGREPTHPGVPGGRRQARGGLPVRRRLLGDQLHGHGRPDRGPGADLPGG
jgi:uncharacterized protein